MNKYAVWTKRDGTSIAVRQMTDEHLINTIRAMEAGRIGFQDAAEQQAWLTVLKAEALQRGRSWEDPAFDKVGLVEWVLKNILGHSSVSLAKARSLLKQHGIEEPQVDISRYSGRATYMHWVTGEGKGKPTSPLPKVGDPVRVDIPAYPSFEGVVVNDQRCPKDRIAVQCDEARDDARWWVFPEQVTVVHEEDEEDDDDE